MTEFCYTEAKRMAPEKREAILADPGFGKAFTDHMLSMMWVEDAGGWQKPKILPYGPIPMEPASAVLHYGQEIFEGMKAYRADDGRILLFRPEENGKRLCASAKRLALPEIPVDLFVESVREFVRVDACWVPAGAGNSLYIRPYMIADESFLGIRSAKRVRFGIIACPAGEYFNAVHGVKIWLSDTLTRAGVGGTGAAKCGGNYAASLLAQNIAKSKGCDQVLFTDGHDRDRIDELGGMNLFLVRKDGTLITPELNGNILPGITRASIIELAQARGHHVEQRRVGVTEWIEGVRSGEIVEAFACGTAAVITPLQALYGNDGPLLDFGEAAPGPLTLSLKEELTGIQRGAIADTRGWVQEVR